jgi:RNA polymerase sigma-70 factor (ECF subfamily)
MQLNLEFCRFPNQSMRMTETDLIKACVSKNPRAQRILYDRYSAKLMTVCRRYCSSTEEAEDAFQEGFVKIFNKISEYKYEGSFDGWLRKVMVNTVIDMMRRNKKHAYHEDVTDLPNIVANAHSPLDAMSANELMELLKTLPDGYRTVFNLFAIEGYSHKEIAEMLGIGESTSKSQFLRARAYIQKKLIEIKFKSERG